METLTLSAEKQTPVYNREQRLYDDTTAWLAEVLDGNMRTPFEYRLVGNELYATDGSPLEPIFDDALAEAESLIDREPDLSFELRRRCIEKQEYRDMIQLAKGQAPNTMVVVSDFPPELMGALEDIGGYNVKRKQTMLRVITLRPDGVVEMRSQSLDGSDRLALERVYDSLGFEAEPGELLGQRMHLDLAAEDQEFLVDQLMGVYDRALTLQFGGQWRAGRPNETAGNTYDFVRSQDDLIRSFMTAAETAEDREGLLYNLAAAMRRRFDGYVVPMPNGQYLSGIDPAMQEMHQAGRRSRQAGESFSGCGVSLGPQPGNESAEEQLDEAGYGNQSQEDKYGSLSFTCKKGHWNTRPRNRLIPRCKTCGVSVKC